MCEKKAGPDTRLSNRGSPTSEARAPRKYTMDRIQLAGLVLGCAAIGALVSSAINAFSQWLERKARREEMLLEKAMSLADWRFEIAKHNAVAAKRYVEMSDKIVATEAYYKLLEHLMKHGELPSAFKEDGDNTSRSTKP